MANHAYAFEGGEVLQRIGTAWFVSYAYHERIDRTHMNWEDNNLTQNSKSSRASRYNTSRSYHRSWLNHILEMNDLNLEKNTIGLTGPVIKSMAKRLLQVTT